MPSQHHPAPAETRPVRVATVPLGDGHELKITATTRRGRNVAEARLWSVVYSAHSGVRTVATRRGFIVPADALPALVDALAAAVAILATTGGPV